MARYSFQHEFVTIVRREINICKAALRYGVFLEKLDAFNLESGWYYSAVFDDLDEKPVDTVAKHGVVR